MKGHIHSLFESKSHFPLPLKIANKFNQFFLIIVQSTVP
jgi:hypothetical protein